jgi:hypothetical protein
MNIESPLLRKNGVPCLFFNRLWAQSAEPADKQDGKCKPARRREHFKGRESHPKV